MKTKNHFLTFWSGCWTPNSFKKYQMDLSLQLRKWAEVFKVTIKNWKLPAVAYHLKKNPVLRGKCGVSAPQELPTEDFCRNAHFTHWVSSKYLGLSRCWCECHSMKGFGKANSRFLAASELPALARAQTLGGPHPTLPPLLRLWKFQVPNTAPLPILSYRGCASFTSPRVWRKGFQEAGRLCCSLISVSPTWTFLKKTK